MRKDYNTEKSDNDVYVKSSILSKNSSVELFNAIFENNTEKMQNALSSGADIKAVREDNGKDIGIIEYLIKYGPKAYSWEEKEIEYNKKNGNLIKMLNILQSMDISLLEKQPLSGFGGNYDNYFAQVIIGRSLKEIEKNPNNWSEKPASSFGDSWIEHAINNGKNSLVEQLISKPNNENIPWGLIESKNGQTVLTMIAYSKDQNLINKIFNDIDENNVNISLDNNNRWSMATEILSQVDNAPSGMIEIMKQITEKLVEKGADLNIVRDEFLKTTNKSIEDRKVASAIINTIELSQLEIKRTNKLSM